MSKKYAKWLRKEMRGIKALMILMILIGLPIFFSLVYFEFIIPDYVLVYYFFYMMTWAAVNSILQMIYKPRMLRKKRDEYFKENPEIPQEIKDAISRGKVIKGMDAYMCSISTGWQYRELPSDSGQPVVTTMEKNVKGSML